jgi:2,4-didehydro-3-deoxy-L-rhamnonate hydrolase
LRLCTFTLPGEAPDRRRVGLVQDKKVFELRKRTTMIALLESGSKADRLEATGKGHSLEKVVLAPPVPRPGKIVATIVNTQAMLGGDDLTLDRPRLDLKVPSIVIGPGAKIIASSKGIRPEVELAAIVGRRVCRADDVVAASSIFGYTVLNDVTAPSDSREDAYEAYRRDRSTGKIKKSIMRGPLFRSKNQDTFCPMGPWIATTEENEVWSELRMTTKFEGESVQEGSTSEYLFSPSKIISYISGFLTLEPGDVVSCGSVGWTKSALGDFDPTEFVLPKRDGTLELEIEGVGRLVNPVHISRRGLGTP